MAHTKTVALLDGHSLAYRAFFALPTSLVTTSGQLTNAVYGFLSMLIRLLIDEKPEGVIVCFDLATPKFRLDTYPEYKAGRTSAPDDFREQIAILREVLQVMGIPIFEEEGWEADDLLATLARHISDRGDHALVVSGDRDVLQLVGERTTALLTGRGVTDTKRYAKDQDVVDRYGVTPKQWPDYAALKGETSDNLPGVKGVGEKTAAALVNAHGDIEGVIAAADTLKPKLAEAVREATDQVRINKLLNKLHDDIDLDIREEQLTLAPFDLDLISKSFASLEFPTLFSRLREIAEPAESQGSDFAVERVEAEIPTLRASLFLYGDVIAVGYDASRCSVMDTDEALTFLKGWFADPTKPKVVHDAKPLIKLMKSQGLELKGLEIDSHIAAYLLEPGLPGGYPLSFVAEKYAGINIGEPPPATLLQGLGFDDESTGDFAAKCAAATFAAVDPLLSQLEARGMDTLATALEFPLIDVLASMEARGILIDAKYLSELGDTLDSQMTRLRTSIHSHAGEIFNVNSNTQLQRVLFEELGLPKTRKIKTGFSTDQAELEKLSGAHPIIADIRSYRELAKLKSGFTDSLGAQLNPKTNRIHTTFVQTAASTGRLSSTAPNVQNIPIRGDHGRQIRRAFIASDGCLLISADYSQIELRVLAHLCLDQGIIDAFASGHDFHTEIASRVYGTQPTDVTEKMRSFAKQFSYGIAYGMSAFGVSQRLSIEMEEAKAFVDAYYAQFPRVWEFLQAQVDQARTDGYTKTMFGRRRYLPELTSPSPRVRSMGERMALNAPIQGTAADIIKRAMIDVSSALESFGPRADLLLSVHDELVLEVDRDHIDEATEIIVQNMRSAADLACPLEVNVQVGANWDEAHA